MAQGAKATPIMAANGTNGINGEKTELALHVHVSLTSEQQHEYREILRLLQFKDEVVNGQHPHFKLPHVPGKAAQSPSSAVSPAATAALNVAAVNGNSKHSVIDKPQAPQSLPQRPPPQLKVGTSMPDKDKVPAGPSSSKPFSSASASMSARPEINPILLEKSDDLIKAEIQLDRQRIERSLRDELEQRRASSRYADQPAEFDLAEVFEKAQALVGPSRSQSTEEAAANASAPSDSFDDNTFYSSQNDTPESRMAARLASESSDGDLRDGSPYEPRLDTEPVNSLIQAPPAAQVHQPTPPAQLNAVQAQPIPTAPVSNPVGQLTGFRVPGLSVEATTGYGQLAVSVASRSLEGTSAARLGEETGAPRPQAAAAHDGSRRNGEQAFGQSQDHPPSPVVRAHNLSPIAPQPEHVSPLALARPSHLVTTDYDGRRATPAQVAALRKQPSAGSSPDSSPQSGKVADRKRVKKKKRKERAGETASAASPYIKLEPRSPSPVSASLPRPAKRQKPSQPTTQELRDAGARYDQPISIDDSYQEYQPRVVRQERVVGYERDGGYLPRHDAEPVLITSPRYERVYYQDAPATFHERPMRPSSPSAQPSYVSREVRTVRPMSHVVDGTHDDSAAYYRDGPSSASRAAPRPAYTGRSHSPMGYDRPPPAMAPPAHAPRRIVVDAYGREYIEPVTRQPTIVREEALAPETRGLIPASERMYERPPLPPSQRAVSRRPDAYDDDVVVYRPQSPSSYPIARRVVTQPAYATAEYRGYGQPAGAMPPPPSEYMPTRALPSQENPREYIARSASVRPPMAESARYEPSPSVGYERRIPLSDERASSREFYGATTPSQSRPVSARPSMETGARYEMNVGYERRVGDEYGVVRSAIVRPPPGAVSYEAPSRADHGVFRVPSVRPPEYPGPSGYHGSSASMGRAYSVMSPGEGVQGVRREYSAQPPSGGGGERYYGRPLQGEDEVVYVERSVYRDVRGV